MSIEEAAAKLGYDMTQKALPAGQETFDNGAAKFGPEDTFGTSGYDAETETRMRAAHAFYVAERQRSTGR